MSVTSLLDVPAPAKINLFLHVLGRRPDGYHLLQSAFVLIDWADTLHFELRSDAQLQRHDLSVPLPSIDLCLRAAHALQVASQTTLGADISIDKKVPWGAGMGGGSSDAATCLLALNRLWGLHWPLSRLMALGLTLGADVPFFLGGHNAWVEGIGEQLTPLNLPRQWLAVIKPVTGLETRAIFSSSLLARNTDAAIVTDFVTETGVQNLLEGFGCNALQAPAEHECPEVAQATRLLEARFGNSRMTGSGSAVFARAGTLVKTPVQPQMVEPSELPNGWLSRMCHSLEQHPLLGWCSGQS
jgi:4-diphosphocytidyl-2-C-methyl-D-erythritol kinase